MELKATIKNKDFTFKLFTRDNGLVKQRHYTMGLCHVMVDEYYGESSLAGKKKVSFQYDKTAFNDIRANFEGLTEQEITKGMMKLFKKRIHVSQEFLDTIIN